jgi:hypothetical protein
MKIIANKKSLKYVIALMLFTLVMTIGATVFVTFHYRDAKQLLASDIINEDESDLVFISAYSDEPESYKSVYTGNYLVGIHDGFVAVFHMLSEYTDEYILMKVTDTHVSTLPENDRMMLEMGIIAETENKVNRILEDYGS